MKSIKELRESHGYTQAQFADLLDVSIGTVRNWEQNINGIGKRSKKDIKTLFPDVNELNAFFNNENVYENIDKLVSQEEV